MRLPKVTPALSAPSPNTEWAFGATVWEVSTVQLQTLPTPGVPHHLSSLIE